MLGFYDNFPETIHKATSFTTLVSTKRLQQALIEVLRKLNNEAVNLGSLTAIPTASYTVNFEVGIAENSDFNYLDNQEAEKIMKYAHKMQFQNMDFLICLKYSKTENEKKSQRFDYYMLRFSFDLSALTIYVFHERGSRHVTPEDLADFIARRINEGFSRKVLVTHQIG